MPKIVNVSVIVITKNRPRQLSRCLHSLAGQTIRPAEVIVVDSSDRSEITVLKHPTLLVTYHHAPHLSIPTARQAGLDLARNSIALFLDDDCTAERCWLEKMFTLAARYPRAALIAGRLIHVPRTSLYAQIISDIRARRLSQAGDDSFLYFNIENCLIRRLFINRCKIRFDESMLHEDFADFALQVKKCGGEIIISDQSVIYHHERHDLRSFLRQRWKNSGNLIRLRQKWPNQRFHFFASARASFLQVVLDRASSYLSTGRAVDCLKYLVVVFLSVVTYETGNLITRLSYADNLNRAYFKIKPVLDLIFSVLLFFLFLPAMLIIGIIVRLDSPGPVIFSQFRVGKDLKPFRFYKFRTMWVDSKKRFPQLYNYKMTPTEVETYVFKTADDPRLTQVGRLLRKTSLDELPNLVNVILGEMSLVGPRPEIPEMIRYYDKDDRLKFSVKPGITGYAQVKGRGLLTFRRTISCDRQYVSHQGLFFDAQIILWTIHVVLRGLGAF